MKSYNQIKMSFGDIILRLRILVINVNILIGDLRKKARKTDAIGSENLTTEKTLLVTA